MVRFEQLDVSEIWLNITINLVLFYSDTVPLTSRRESYN